MFFKEFVEQHGVHRIIANSVNFAVLVAHYKVRVHLGYLFGDQAKLRRLCLVALVMERHRLKRQD